MTNYQASIFRVPRLHSSFVHLQPARHVSPAKLQTMGFSLTIVSLLHSAIAGLPVNQLITTFLRPGRFLSISDACRFNSIELLDWIWDFSCTSVHARTREWSTHNYLRTDVYYHCYQFGKALLYATKEGNLELVKWLFTHFSGCIAPADVVEVAARNGFHDILKCLLDHDAGRFGPHLKYRDDENSKIDCDVSVGSSTTNKRQRCHLEHVLCGECHQI